MRQSALSPGPATSQDRENAASLGAPCRGEVAQVRADHPRFAMGQDVCLLRKLSLDQSSDYLQHVIRSPIIIQQLANLMIGSTFKRINVEEIRTFMVPSPPSSEQATIAGFLESEIHRLDAHNGTHFDVVSSDSLGLSGFLRF